MAVNVHESQVHNSFRYRAQWIEENVKVHFGFMAYGKSKLGGSFSITGPFGARGENFYITIFFIGSKGNRLDLVSNLKRSYCH